MNKSRVASREFREETLLLEHFQRFRRPSVDWEGHDFGRAARDTEEIRALAPEGLVHAPLAIAFWNERDPACI